MSLAIRPCTTEQGAAQHKPVALLRALCNSASALYSSRHTQ